MRSSDLKSLTLAIMNGDCYVDVNEKSGKARLDIYHESKSYDLLIKKKAILESINGVKVTLSEKHDNRELKNGKVRSGYRLQTNFSRYFYKLNNMPFKFTAKQLVKPAALAILWEDDGTVCWDSKGNFSTSTLALDSWEKWKVEELKKQWNNFYGWSPTVMLYVKSKEQYRLRLIKEQVKWISDSISEHVVDSMKYKLITCNTSKS